MEELDIIVCAKQVPDPEAPPSSFSIDRESMSVVPHGVPPVTNPFDENALELAIRIRELTGGTITMLSMGKSISRAVLLKAMATGADRAVLIEDPAAEVGPAAGSATARALAEAVLRIGRFDLLLAGRQAADTNSGQVAIGLSVLLGIPCVTRASSVEVRDGRLLVERTLPDSLEVVEVSPPAALITGPEAGDLRYPKIADIKAAKGRPCEVLHLADLGVEQSGARRVRLLDLTQPVRERRCQMVDGESGAEAGERLAALLQGEGVI